MKKQFRLIGHPLGHSLSPQIHRALFALGGFDADYALLPFAPEELEARFPALAALDGFNVTIPYKRAVLPFLDAQSESAALYGAVNTVLRDSDGRLTGHNTDCDGFLQTMRTHGISLQTEVCVLGAGGVGRMFAIESARQGAEVTIAVRGGSLEKGAQLAAELSQKTGSSARVCAIDTLAGGFGLLINATPVGMFPHVDASPIPAALLDGASAVFDCIYNPAETLLLRDARARGIHAVGGMDMLVWQAAAAQELWRGCKFDPDGVRAVITQMNESQSQKERDA